MKYGEKRYTLKDIYRHYVADGGTLAKSVYKNICSDFNIHAMNHIIYEAGVIDMGNYMSTISVMKLKRDFRNPSIDWKASNEYRKELEEKGEKLYDAETGEGTKWLIYHDEEWYCRFYWQRRSARFKNKKVYKFVATRGKRGNKTKLKKHLNESPLNIRKYRTSNKEEK